MKKLSVILLAIVFVFGLAAQAGAEVTEVGVDAFAGDEIITFFVDEDGNGLNDLSREIPITRQFEELGVVFLEGWYIEDFFSILYWNMPFAAGNLDLNTFTTTQIPIRMSFVDPVTRVGFDLFSLYATEVIVKTYRDNVETGSLYLDSGSKRFLGVDDPEGIDALEISANGFFSRLTDFVIIDNLTFGGTADTGPTEIEVAMYVKPPSCSGAPINVRSRGVTPVVVVGTDDLDVTMIDTDSIELNGVAPVRSAIEDVPYCSNLEPDGIWDLTLKFDTQELVGAMAASLVEGETLETDCWMTLELTGSLFDDTLIVGEDQVTIKGKPAQENKGKKKGKK